MLTKQILRKVGDSLIETIKIATLNQTTQVTNELLATLMQRDTSENGYKGFEIDYWDTVETPLEQEILNQLQGKLVHVKNFSAKFFFIF